MKYRKPSWHDSKEITCNNCGHSFKIDSSRVKCDCDADIVLNIWDEINNYSKAILITSDGDFDNVVKRLIELNKLYLVLAPCKEGCSNLLVRAARGRIAFLDELLDEMKKY